MVLVCGGGQGPTCYIETAAIDGEMNLKMKNPCIMLALFAYIFLYLYCKSFLNDM